MSGQATPKVGKDDLIVWKGVEYRLRGRKDGITYVQGRLDANIREQFTDAQLRDIWKHSSQFSYHRDYFAIGGGKKVSVPGPTLSTLRDHVKAITLRNVAFVEMFITAHAQGKYKRTYESAAQAAKDFQPIIDALGKGVDVAQKTITSEFSSKPRKVRVNSPNAISSVVEPDVQKDSPHNYPCGETLLRHVWKYEKAFGDPLSLRPKYENCGYYGSHVTPEVDAIVVSCMPEYLTKEQLGPSAILASVISKIDQHNELVDGAAGEKKLSHPHLNTIIHAINQIDPYYACLMRYDETIANLKFGWAAQPIDIRVPGQRVEMDAYKVDLMTLLCWAGAWETMTPEERKLVRRKRMWLTIAIDKATRCVLAMRLHGTTDAPNAVATLAMIESDKTIYSKAAGCDSQWHHQTGVMTLVVDGGYVSDEVRTALGEARGTVEYPDAGDPTMRATIERMFRTVATKIIARLKGKTFSDIVKRGEYDSEKRAALTIDELAWVLVTWVVDIYHNTPHEGLRGKTPNMAWDDAFDAHDIRSWRDANGRRAAFGVRLQRSLTDRGFEVMGNYYRDFSKDGAMGERFKNTGKKYTICVDLTNLGAISFIDGDVAKPVPCEDDEMEGVHADTWMEVNQKVRAENQHRTSLPRAIAHRALDRIKAVNEAAGRRASIVDRAHSAEDIERFEKLYFGGAFRYADPSPSERSSAVGQVIRPIAPESVTNLYDQRFTMAADDGQPDDDTIPVAAATPPAADVVTAAPAPEKPAAPKRPLPVPPKTYDLED